MESPFSRSDLQFIALENYTQLMMETITAYTRRTYDLMSLAKSKGIPLEEIAGALARTDVELNSLTQRMRASQVMFQPEEE